MKLNTIDQIFTNTIFRIPSYQRGYSWGNEKLSAKADLDDLRQIQGQLIDLWKDIINLKEGKWHYMGLITLVRSKEKDYPWLSDYDQFFIVDGQKELRV